MFHFFSFNLPFPTTKEKLFSVEERIKPLEYILNDNKMPEV